MVTPKNECPRSVGTKLVDLGCVFFVETVMGEVKHQGWWFSSRMLQYGILQKTFKVQ